MKNVCAARVVHNIQHTQHYCLCLLCMYRLCTLRVCSTWYVYTHDRVVPGNNTGPVRTQLLSNTQTVLVLPLGLVENQPTGKIKCLGKYLFSRHPKHTIGNCSLRSVQIQFHQKIEPSKVKKSKIRNNIIINLLC